MALLRAQAMCWLRPTGELVCLTAPAYGVTRLTSEEWGACHRVALAMDRAARYGLFRPPCLWRALALSRMLARRGFITHRIRIGVRKENEGFTAHAWVELGDSVVGDTTANTGAYTRLTDVSLNRDGRFSSRHFWLGSSRARRGEKFSWSQ